VDACFVFRAGISKMCLVYFSPKYDLITGLENKTEKTRPHSGSATESLSMGKLAEIKESKALM